MSIGFTRWHRHLCWILAVDFHFRAYIENPSLFETQKSFLDRSWETPPKKALPNLGYIAEYPQKMRGFFTAVSKAHVGSIEPRPLL